MSIYKEINEKILEKLKKGVIPWKHYIKGKCSLGYPKNIVTGKEYRGINVWTLADDFPSDRFGTYKQFQAMGKSVKKGEKGHPVYFWKFLEKEVEGKDKLETIPFMKKYFVFNESQCEGYEVSTKKKEENLQFKAIEQAEEILSKFPIGFPKPQETTKTSAFYRPRTDEIFMPKKEWFVSSTRYYAVLFHESIHATGHKSRLKREGVEEVSSFGSETYSKEELVAELGASYLCGKAEILEDTIENQASYLENWMRKIKKEESLFVRAAGLAQKSTDYLLGVKFED